MQITPQNNWRLAFEQSHWPCSLFSTLRHKPIPQTLYSWITLILYPLFVYKNCQKKYCKRISPCHDRSICNLTTSKLINVKHQGEGLHGRLNTKIYIKDYEYIFQNLLSSLLDWTNFSFFICIRPSDTNWTLFAQCGVAEMTCLRGALHPRVDITPITMNA